MCGRTCPLRLKVQLGRQHSERWLHFLSFGCGPTVHEIGCACHLERKDIHFFSGI